MAAVGINTATVSDYELSTEGRRVIDMSPKLFMLEPNAAPLCSLLMSPGFSKIPAKSTKVEWLSSVLLPAVTSAAQSWNNSDTTVAVATGTGAYFRPGDIVLNTASAERFLVVSISTDTLTVKRGLGTSTYGTTGTASVGSTDQFMRVANAQAQGSTLGAIRQVQYSSNYNYTQITRTALGFTRSATQTTMYGGDEPAVEQARKAIEHKAELERNLFFGGRQIDTSGAQPLTTMGGLSYYVTTHVTASVGTLTERIWNDFLQGVGRYNSDSTKIIFVSPLVYSAINSFVRGRLAIDDSGANIKNYGVALNSYTSPTGDKYGLVLKRDWADTSTVTGSPGGSAFVVDMNNIQLCPLQDTLYREGMEANDEDSKKSEYLTEQSCRITNEQTHGILTGVTTY